MSYTFTAAEASIGYMQTEIDNAAISNGGIMVTDDQMTILGTFTPTDETTIDGFVPGSQLEYAREAKLDEVLANTKNLVLEGFSYSSKVFALILDSRSNYIGIQVFGGFPYNLQTKDHDDVLLISDQAAYNLFAGAGITRYGYIKDGESDLVIEIRDATTIALVNAIVDTRV